MLSQDQIEALCMPFPSEAMSSDTSRGFELTSIKAAYIIERLNQVFGPCGSGWRYVHSPFEPLGLKNDNLEIVTEVAFQYRLNGVQDGMSGSAPVEWCSVTNGWNFRTEAGRNWSEPIFTCGGKSLGKGGVPNTDARKSAVTDGLTKAVSMIGVGHQVFKGLVRVGRDNGNDHRPTVATRRKASVQPLKSDPRPSAPRAQEPSTQSDASSKDNGNGHHSSSPSADATTFWSLYNREAKPLGISRDEAQRIVSGGNWGQACAILRVMIGKAQKQPASASAN